MTGGSRATGIADLDGRVAIVTGAAKGMGAAASVVLADAGAAVVVADVDVEGAHLTAERICAGGGRAKAVACDVSKESDVAGMVEAAVRAFGGVDCAVNNAAIAPDRGPLVDIEEATIDRILSVNLKSVALCLKHELRRLVAQGRGGAIVNLGSVASVRPRRLNAAYVAAKHGVLGLTKVAAVEHAADGIRVNAILPGGISTPMLAHSRAQAGAAAPTNEDELSLFGRLGEPEEVAEAVLWLCSDRSSYVTGHGLAVDAGYLAR